MLVQRLALVGLMLVCATMVVCSAHAEDEWTEAHSPEENPTSPLGQDDAVQADFDDQDVPVSGDDDDPIVGQKTPYTVTSMKERKIEFLRHELDRIGSLCNRTKISSLKILKVAKQMAAGEKYEIQVEVERPGRETVTKTVTMRRNLPDKQNPVHSPKRDHPEKNHKPYLRSLFHMESIEPHPCPENFGAKLVSEEEAVQYHTGLIPPPVTKMQFVDDDLTDEQRASIPAAFDWTDGRLLMMLRPQAAS